MASTTHGFGGMSQAAGKLRKPRSQRARLEGSAGGRPALEITSRGVDMTRYGEDSNEAGPGRMSLLLRGKPLLHRFLSSRPSGRGLSMESELSLG